jgi:lipoprotein-anchoring transpeptidase ErfK/SrfK
MSGFSITRFAQAFDGAVASGEAFQQLLTARMARRAVLGFGALSLAGCVTDTVSLTPQPAVADGSPRPGARPPAMYRAVSDGGFDIPEVDVSVIDAQFWRTEVAYATDAKPGTLVVDTPNKHLYHVLPNGRATRYGVGVGREGFEWSGRAVVAYGKAWPRWVPPDSMILRQPDLKRYAASAGGMQPGLRNPLGARALYIHENGADTLYRLHGTNEPESIGKAVSSGCIRLLNQDVVHLYENTRNGTPIVVIPDPAMASLMLGGAAKRSEPPRPNSFATTTKVFAEAGASPDAVGLKRRRDVFVRCRNFVPA